jgi:hypothetical protein
MADDSGDSKTAEQKRQTVSLLLAFWGTLAGGVFGILLYSCAESGLRVFAVGLIVAAAAAIVGALFGFLFGLPRANDDLSPAHDAGKNGAPAADPDGAPEHGGANGRHAPRPSKPNNNLLEISDWLTKIIVGAGLVGLKDLTRWLGLVSQTIGTGAGLPDANGRVFGASVITFFFGWGFLFVYIQTRTIISLIFAATERSLADTVKAAVGEEVRKSVETVKATVSDEVRKSVAPALAQESAVGSIMQALYQSPTAAEAQAKAFLSDPANANNSRAWLYLACAVGQQHAAATDPAVRQSMADEVVAALTRALTLDPTLKTQARGYAYVGDPAHFDPDDDLASLGEDPRIQRLLGPPPGA